MAPVKEDAPAKKEDGRKNNGAHLKVPDHLKKPKNVFLPTGKPKGRKPGQKNKKTLAGERLRAGEGSRGKKKPETAE